MLNLELIERIEAVVVEGKESYLVINLSGRADPMILETGEEIEAILTALEDCATNVDSLRSRLDKPKTKFEPMIDP